jgi:hypothetical protein
MQICQNVSMDSLPRRDGMLYRQSRNAATSAEISRPHSAACSSGALSSMKKGTTFRWNLALQSSGQKDGKHSVLGQRSALVSDTARIGQFDLEEASSRKKRSVYVNFGFQSRVPAHF